MFIVEIPIGSPKDDSSCFGSWSPMHGPGNVAGREARMAT